MAFWLIFYLSALGNIQKILLKNAKFIRFVGIAALFSLLSILFDNFSQDSFANVNIWINLGILIGMSQALLTKEKTQESL